MAGDRYDIKYSAKEVARESNRPTKRARAKLKRLARYLVSHRRLIMRYRFLTSAEKRQQRRSKPPTRNQS